MRPKTWLAALAASALVLTGCASTPPSSDSTASDTLIIYSPQGDEERGGFIANKAKEDLGLNITWVTGGGGELQQRLTAEKNNPQADIVLGLTQSSMYQLKDASLFDSYTPAWGEKLDAQYKDADGQFHMFWQTPIVLSYNAKALTADKAPKAWEDLSKPEFKDTYISGNLGSQTTRSYIIGMLWKHADKSTGEVSDEGWAELKKFFDNAKPLAEGAKLEWADVASGSMPIVLSWFGGIQREAEENSIDMAYVNTTGGTPFVMESVALVKGRGNQANAKKFIDWFGGKDFQVAYTKEIGGVTPINTEALAELDPQVRADVEQFDVQDIDWAIVAKQIDGWMEKIQLDIVS